VATCSDAVATTASSSNTTSYASASFTPAANDLLVVFVTASGTVLAAPTLTDSLGAVTFTLIAQCLKNSSADSVYCFVANQLAAASSRTLTFNCTGDSATGCIIQICRVAGMSKTGSTAVRQSKTQPNAAAGTPAPVFPSSCLTGNPTLGVVGNSTSPATMTPPTGWTEREDQGYSTPTTGAEYVTRDSGFTGTTVTWGSASSSAFGAIIVELDTSLPTITAALAATETADTLVASLSDPVAAQLSATEAKDTVAAAVSDPVKAVFSATDTADTLSAAVGDPVGATLAPTEAKDTLSASLSLSSGVSAVMAATEATDTLAAAVSNPVAGQLGATENRDSLVGAIANPVAGSLAVSERADTLAATAASTVAGLLVATEARDLMSLAVNSGTHSDPRVWVGYQVHGHLHGCGPRPWRAGGSDGGTHVGVTPPTFWPYSRPTVGQRLRNWVRARFLDKTVA